MHCHVCGKKLNIFSDYTQIVVNGEKKEICTPCNRLREKKEIKHLSKTEKGREEVARRSALYVTTGFLEIIVGISILYFFPTILPLAFLILVGFGIYSIYKGFSFKKIANKTKQQPDSEQDKDEKIEVTKDEIKKIRKGHKRLSRFYLLILLFWIIVILVGIILIYFFK